MMEFWVKPRLAVWSTSITTSTCPISSARTAPDDSLDLTLSPQSCGLYKIPRWPWRASFSWPSIISVLPVCIASHTRLLTKVPLGLACSVLAVCLNTGREIQIHIQCCIAASAVLNILMILHVHNPCFYIYIFFVWNKQKKMRKKTQQNWNTDGLIFQLNLKINIVLLKEMPVKGFMAPQWQYSWNLQITGFRMTSDWWTVNVENDH